MSFMLPSTFIEIQMDIWTVNLFRSCLRIPTNLHLWTDKESFLTE